VPDAETTVSKYITANYNIAFRQVWANDGLYTLNYPGDDLYHLRRFETPTDWDGARLVAYLDTAIDKSFPFYSEDSLAAAGWRGTWGSMTIEGTDLVLRATEQTTGALAFLDGTNTWKNYEYSADIEWNKGGRIALLARYKGPSDYLSCTLGEDYIRIDRTVDGKSTRVSESENFMHSRMDKVTLIFQMNDGLASCRVSGVAATSGTVPEENGGIGLKIWDPASGNAEIRATGVHVVSER
jgi:hypothetical protein